MPPEFEVTVSFLELYNGAFYDLLDADTDNGSSVDNAQRQPSKIHIRDERLDDGTIQICVTNVHEATVTSVQQLMEQLRRGSMRRVTKSTDMNATSSRSHAVFTLHISHKRAAKSDPSFANEAGPATDANGAEQMIITTSKFNFVDLAVRPRNFLHALAMSSCGGFSLILRCSSPISSLSLELRTYVIMMTSFSL